MRYYILVGLMALFVACNSVDNRKHFAIGTFVSAYRQEYAKGNDTIRISAFGEDGFTIRRHTVFNRIRNGKTWPAETEDKLYSGIWQQDSHTILETSKGVTLSFDPDHREMKWGASVYQKIHN